MDAQLELREGVREGVGRVGHTATRIVLGDWYEQGSVLRWDERGYQLATLAK